MVRVGVSGHRQLANITAISKCVDEALLCIMDTFGEDTMSIISPLAEGADRIVAGRALGYHPAQLVVPMPLEMDEYMLDFNSFSSKAEFLTLLEQADEVFELPAAESREACYLAAGLYVLDHSDVLVAIWDGEPPRGMGGTAEIVVEARRRGMPMAWIQVEQKTKGTRRSVQLHYERFPK